MAFKRPTVRSRSAPPFHLPIQSFSGINPIVAQNLLEPSPIPVLLFLNQKVLRLMNDRRHNPVVALPDRGRLLGNMISSLYPTVTVRRFAGNDHQLTAGSLRIEASDAMTEGQGH